MTVVMDFRNPVTGTDLSDRKRTYPAVNAPGAAECPDRADRRNRHRNGGQAQKQGQADRDEEREFQIGDRNADCRTDCVFRRLGGTEHHPFLLHSLPEQVISRKNGQKEQKHDERDCIKGGCDRHFVAVQGPDRADAGKKIHDAKREEFSSHAATPLSENPERVGTTEARQDDRVRMVADSGNDKSRFPGNTGDAAKIF